MRVPPIKLQINNKKFYEERIAFPLIRHRPHRKRRLQKLLVLWGICSRSRCLATTWRIHRQTHRLSFDATRNAQKTTCPTILPLLRVFFSAGTCLSIRCLATEEGYTYGHTDGWQGFIKYSVEMGSGAMMYIPSFKKLVQAFRS
jgi:hypothetical protein